MEKEKTEDQDMLNEGAPKKEDKMEPTQNTEKVSNEEKSPEDKIVELEEKIVRQYAEMENQRRRYEKEKEDAFEYGDFLC